MAGAVLQLGQACVMVALVAASDDDVAAARLEAAGEWAEVAVSLLFVAAVATLAARSCLRKPDVRKTSRPDSSAAADATSTGGCGNDAPDAPLLAVPASSARAHQHSTPADDDRGAAAPAILPAAAGSDAATPPPNAASLRPAASAHGSDKIHAGPAGPSRPSNPLLPARPRRER
uniref:Uncharacterized protein n=1 Tax=Neobodo designis TaxID=312471 RepID=A0A7S1MLH5_NEODS